MVLPLNETRTTVCCSKCGARTTAPLCATTARTGRGNPRGSVECPACKQQEQGGEGGAAQAGGGEEGVAQVGVGEGGAQVEEGDHAAVLAQSASAKKTQSAFWMHRGLNAAWDLWNVLAAELLGYLGQHI